jgi:hypothetical protein
MRTPKIGRALALAGITALALALTAGGAVAGGKGKQLGKLAAKECAKERKAIGNEAFDGLYGKPAIPNCIGVTKPEVAQAKKQAAKECKAEGLKGKAFGKCVSGKVKPALAADRAETVNAAKECKAEQVDPAFADGHEGQSFDEFYGTNPNDRNAFGKCVSGKAKATA